MTVDLATRYLGLELRSPIVASAAPQNADPLMVRRLERAGVGAIVLPSLFEEEILAEEIELNRSLEQGTEHFAEALDYFPNVEGLDRRGRPLPCRDRADQGPGDGAHHREPERAARPGDGSITHDGSRMRARMRSS